jgi:hypothetical protein
MISDFALLQSLRPIEESQTMSSQLYVYYRISLQQGRTLLPRLRQMQAMLAVHGVQASLMRKQDEAANADLQTWMEVYREVDDSVAFTCQLQQALQDYGLEQALTERHAEWFVALDD